MGTAPTLFQIGSMGGYRFTGRLTKNQARAEIKCA